MDSSFAIAANSASSLISLERLALFSTLAILGLITYRFRKVLMNKVRDVLLNFLRDDRRIAPRKLTMKKGINGSSLRTMYWTSPLRLSTN